MAKAEEYFNVLTAAIKDVKPGKMFGALCIKTPNGKAAAMFWKDNIVIKLDGDAHKQALALKGAQLFDPMDGRPMKEWVQVPYAHKDQWKNLIQTSVENVRKLEAKAPKKK